MPKCLAAKVSIRPRMPNVGTPKMPNGLGLVLDYGLGFGVACSAFRAFDTFGFGTSASIFHDSERVTIA